MRRFAGTMMLTAISLVILAYPAFGLELRLSHQFPGADGEWRHQAMLRFADEVAKSNVDLKVTIYPSEQLFKAREQWKAMAEGILDLSILQLSDNTPVPEMGITALPTLIRDHDQADRIAQSSVAALLNKVAESQGVIIIDHFSQSAAIGASGACPLSPGSLQGLAVRAPGTLFNKIMEGAGAVSLSLASNELKPALQSGALDLIVTASQSFLSFGFEKELKCLVVPGRNGIMTMLMSLTMSKKSWDKLSPAQQKAISAAAEAAHRFAAGETRKVDGLVAERYRTSGVAIAELGSEQFAEWRVLAEKTAFPLYRASGPAAQPILDAALAVK